MSEAKSSRILRAPVNVTWEITLRCNLRCVHCLSDAGRELDHELSTEECLQLINQMAALKVFQLNIGGGEPFLRNDFIDLMTHAQGKGIVTCVSTNGMLVDRALAGRLSSLKMLNLQVSLDGATDSTNDSIRGPGTYKRIIQALDCLASQGVRFSINTVLTRTNFEQLEDLMELARSFKAELRVSRFRPSGRGRESKEWLGPDKDQLEAFAEWLNRNDLVRTGDSFFCLTSDSRRQKGLDMCGAAKMTCCVSPAGLVFPCAFLQVPPFLAGDIRRQGLGDIWMGSGIFAMFRNLDVKSCLDCYRFESCRGGCPAMAYHTYQDISMPDPECLVNLKSWGRMAAGIRLKNV